MKSHDGEYETVRFDVDGALATIGLDRPRARNAINSQMIEELEDILGKVCSPGIRAVVLLGSDDIFCAGADIKEMGGPDRRPPTERYRFFRTLAELDCPTVAGIRGAAVGGGLELALCCDLRVVARDARLGLPESKLGVIPAAGGTQRLPRLVGPARAKELMFLGSLINGDEAYRLGIADRVVNAEAVVDETMALARGLAEAAPLALRAIKRAVDEGAGRLPLEQGLDLEQALAAELRETEDHREGVRAFAEKRPPRFEGR